MSFALTKLQRILFFRNQSLVSLAYSSTKAFGIHSNVISRNIHTRASCTLNARVKIHPVKELPQRKTPRYAGGLYTQRKTLVWSNGPPRNILIVKKPHKHHVTEALLTLLNHIYKEYPRCNIILKKEAAKEIYEIGRDDKHATEERHIYTGTNSDIVGKADLLISLGGDGTILRGVSMFSNGTAPPVLSFSMGTLGFLLPFDFKDYEPALRSVFEGKAKVMRRERLECHIIKKKKSNSSENFEKEREKEEQALEAEEERDDITESNSYSMHSLHVHAMNDIVMHRGALPGLINLDVFINGHFLTRTIADGLIFATPTGSTAYSLSAGGSIVHSFVRCIMITSICPRSLSFRPLILPTNSRITVKITAKNDSISANSEQSDLARNITAKLSVDGIPVTELGPGDEIHVLSESEPKVKGKEDITETHIKKYMEKGVWCVTRSDGDWVNGINGMLGFNSAFHTKP